VLVPLERLEERICELAAQLAAGTCRFLQLVAEFDARGGWASPGHGAARRSRGNARARTRRNFGSKPPANPAGARPGRRFRGNARRPACGHPASPIRSATHPAHPARCHLDDGPALSPPPRTKPFPYHSDVASVARRGPLPFPIDSLTCLFASRRPGL
jgi:hypothetical protein